MSNADDLYRIVFFQAHDLRCHSSVFPLGIVMENRIFLKSCISGFREVALNPPPAFPICLLNRDLEHVPKHQHVVDVK